MIYYLILCVHLFVFLWVFLSITAFFWVFYFFWVLFNWMNSLDLNEALTCAPYFTFDFNIIFISCYIPFNSNHLTININKYTVGILPKLVRFIFYECWFCNFEKYALLEFSNDLQNNIYFIYWRIAKLRRISINI